MLKSGVVTAAVLLFLAVATGERMWPSTTARAGRSLAGLALISHAGGQSLIAYALAHLPATFSAVGLLLQPAIAALLAWLLFAEAIGGWQAAGAAVILAGIVLARRGSVAARGRRQGAAMSALGAPWEPWPADLGHRSRLRRPAGCRRLRPHRS